MAQDIKTLQGLLPSVKDSGLLTNFQRITQPTTDFIRGNPIVSTAAIGIGTTGLIAGAITAIRKRRKTKRAKAKVKKRKAPKKKNGRRVKRKVGKRRIIRGRGLGRGEIKHSGRGTKGTKFVSFTTKDGKRVRFKVKGTSKRRKGFVRIRRSRLK